MISAADALRRLQVGNRRFVAGELSSDALASPARRSAVVEDQRPFAIILGCSDSRVPAEIVFDQGLGDLFVIRVAGNVVAPSQIGSVEFATEWFGTRLVVVLGHSRCGAVLATLDVLTGASGHPSRNLRSIVDRVRPSVEPLLEAFGDSDRDGLVHRAVRANVRAATNQLRHGSEQLEQLILHGDLMIVGAEYSLDTGEVDFFEGVAES
ncbi:MAG: carbonic anhydrase [Pseudomonadales bacterium]